MVDTGTVGLGTQLLVLDCWWLRSRRCKERVGRLMPARGGPGQMYLHLQESGGKMDAEK